MVCAVAIINSLSDSVAASTETGWTVDHWLGLVRTVVMTAGILFGVFKYVGTRNRELGWKRTAFLFEQARYLDEDADINKAVSIMSGEAGHGVDEVMNDDGSFKPGIDTDVRHGFEKLVNFLDRVSYAAETHQALSVEELQNFGWYLQAIRNDERLVHYCRKYNFDDVLALADKVIAARQSR